MNKIPSVGIHFKIDKKRENHKSHMNNWQIKQRKGNRIYTAKTPSAFLYICNQSRKSIEYVSALYRFAKSMRQFEYFTKNFTFPNTHHVCTYSENPIKKKYSTKNQFLSLILNRLYIHNIWAHHIRNVSQRLWADQSACLWHINTPIQALHFHKSNKIVFLLWLFFKVHII